MSAVMSKPKRIPIHSSDKFEECRSCINGDGSDPLECEECDDACNYIPAGDDDFEDSGSSDMSYADFLTWIGVSK